MSTLSVSQPNRSPLFHIISFTKAEPKKNKRERERENIVYPMNFHVAPNFFRKTEISVTLYGV